jgi:hypothetical protein
LLALAGGAALLTVLLRRRHLTVAHEPEPEPPARKPWTPQHKSTMTGPGWTEPRPESDEDAWTDAPKQPEPDGELSPRGAETWANP